MDQKIYGQTLSNYGRYATRRYPKNLGSNPSEPDQSVSDLLRLLDVKNTNPALASSIVPTVDVNALLEREFGSILDQQGDQLTFVGSIPQPAAFAAPDQRIQLWNPANSNVMVKVMKFVTIQGTNGTVFCDIIGTALSQLHSINNRSSVVIGNPNPKAEGRYNIAADPAPTVIKNLHSQIPQYPGAQVLNMLFDQPIWLKPGRGICWRNIGGSLTGNQWVNAVWRELPL